MKKFILYILILSIPVLKSQAQEARDTSNLMSKELQEVVIKASKDNITHKKIPASVSVISTESLKQNEVRSLNEITSSAPNFFMPDYGSKLTSPVYIRGIGSRINSPSVGLYVDYVPYFEKASFNFDFFDIKRIEVLRGPQGTLFGRNTMGGIVNIITTSPMDYQGSHIDLTSGNYGVYSLNAGHYARAGKKLAYSLAVNLHHNDGYYKNMYTRKNVDELNSYGLRNRIIYEFSKKFTIENIAGYELSKQGGYPYALYNDTLKVAEKINYNQYSSYDRRLFSDAVIAKYTGNSFEIMSTTSYQYLKDDQKIDQDFTPDSLYFIVQKQEQHMLSEEVVVRSTDGGSYKWLVGGYFFYQQFNNSVHADVYKQKLNYLKKYDHSIAGTAFFHQSSVSDFLVKNLTFTGGIRIDLERDQLDYFYDKTQKGKYALVADTIYPSLASVEIIPRVALNYQVNTNNFYIVVAKGYKTGGFNSTFERPEDLTFDPEYSWNYETGVKSAFFKNRLSADLSLFYIDWKNQQIYQTVPSGRGSMLKNAGHSSSKGVELTITTAPVEGFDFMLAYGFTDAKFITYWFNDTVNYNKNRIPYVPQNTVALQAGKTFNLKNTTILDKIRLSAVYKGAGDIWWDEENTQKQKYYGLVDGKISFFRKSLQLDIWTKNLLNTDYNSFYFEALGNRYVQTGKPAQFGVNLGIKF